METIDEYASGGRKEVRGNRDSIKSGLELGLSSFRCR